LSKLSIIIPLCNEEGNIEKLVEELKNHFSVEDTCIYLLDNGSEDKTKQLIQNAVEKNGFLFQGIYLPENLGYGGGVRKGFEFISSEWVCWIPGDLQVRPSEVKDVWDYIKFHGNTDQVVKGKRISREDGWLNLCASKFYTMLGIVVLGLKIKDLNALPKFFPVDFIQQLPEKMERSFVFDAEMLYHAHMDGMAIIEYPVGWYKRYSGVSSWSGKRWQVYFITFAKICLLRFKKVSS